MSSLSSRSNDTPLPVFTDPYLSSMGDNWDTLIGLIILSIIIGGAVLNSLVLCTFVKMKQMRQRPTNTDYYIIALAASDFCVVSLCYRMTFLSTISHQWLFGDVGCIINGFLGFLFSLIDVGVLTTMSLHRLLSVKMPHCAFVKAPRYTVLTLMGVILYALFWTTSPIVGWGHFAPEPFGTSCTVDWKNPNRSYVTSVFIGVLAIPLLVMLVCYSCVVYHMRVSFVRLGPYMSERKRRAKRQNRLVRIAVLMCVCFLTIWLPYSVLSICFAYVPDFYVYPVHLAIPTVIAKSSHVVNPLICFIMNQTYRRRVKCFCLQYVLKKVPDLENSKSCRASYEVPVEKISIQTTELPVNTCISHSLSNSLLFRHKVVFKTELMCLNGCPVTDENRKYDTNPPDFNEKNIVFANTCHDS